jgi:hypothetical protein
VALDFWRAAVSDEQARAESAFIEKQLQLSVVASGLTLTPAFPFNHQKTDVCISVASIRLSTLIPVS